MVKVKRRAGARARKTCTVCKKRDRVRGFDVCKHSGKCFERYREQLAEKEKLKERIAEGVCTRRQCAILGKQIDDNDFCAHAIDGTISVFDVDEKLLPKKYPVLDTTDDSPRQLIADDGDHGLALRNFLKKMVRGMDGVRKAIAGQGFFVGSLGRSDMEKYPMIGKIHRDTAKKQLVSVTCLVWLETYETGGVRVWEGSHQFKGGSTLVEDVKCLNQTLNRRFKKQDYLPGKWQGIAFDSRLAHQSLRYMDNKVRLVYGCVVSVNANKRIDGEKEQCAKWVTRKRYNWKKIEG